MIKIANVIVSVSYCVFKLEVSSSKEGIYNFDLFFIENFDHVGWDGSQSFAPHIASSASELLPPVFEFESMG